MINHCVNVICRHRILNSCYGRGSEPLLQQGSFKARTRRRAFGTGGRQNWTVQAHGGDGAGQVARPPRVPAPSHGRPREVFSRRGPTVGDNSVTVSYADTSLMLSLCPLQTWKSFDHCSLRARMQGRELKWTDVPKNGGGWRLYTLSAFPRGDRWLVVMAS